MPALIVRRSAVGPSVPSYTPQQAFYTGPGDIVSGATAWWGLRAYRNSSIGTNAIRLRRDSDNAEQDFVTIGGGGLDLSGIISFKGADNLFVVKLYDQTGSGRDESQTVAGNQPALILNALGSLPVIRFDGIADGFDSGSVASGLNLPVSYSIVAKVTGNIGVQQTFFTSRDAVAAIGAATGSTTNTWFLYNGLAPTVTANDNVMHAGQGVFNGASSVLMIDGVDTTINPGSSNITDTGFYIGSILGAQPTAGDMTEVGVWPIGFASGDRSSMNSNQHSFWNF